MKKLSYLFALLFLASTIFIACGSDNDDPTPEPPVIEVPNKEELEQTVYADEEEGESGVRFTTIAPWTSSVRDVRSATETRADDDAETRSTEHWLSLTPSSGGAGSHTVALTLEPNLTGEDRTAVISINSAGTVLEISITQQGVRGDGTVPVASVTLCETTATLFVGSTKTFTATVAPDNATNTNVLWSSNNHVVAIVNADGMVTAVSVGTAQITALSQDGNHTAIVEVTVVPVPVTGVMLNKDYTTIIIGNTETLIATVKPDNAANQSVTWSSSNPLVASVDEQGNVTALSAGETIITVTTECGGYTASATITVEGVIINGVRWATRNVDAPGTFAENPEDAGMFFQWGSRVGWSSTDPIVSSEGHTYWVQFPRTGATEWSASNDPCPVGWRVPTGEELISLINAGHSWTTNWNDTGVNGLFVGSAPNQIFLPAVGGRNALSGELFGVDILSVCWGSTTNHQYFPHNFFFWGNVGIGGPGIASHTSGYSVRCVAE